jgi:lathosterol oxidase
MADRRRERRRKAHLSLETTEPTSFGHGFVSGLLSALLGIAGFGAVLCFHFPELLTHVELRGFYSPERLRPVLHVVLVASFLLGCVSVVLRANKTLAVVGIGFTLAAALLGGSRVAVEDEVGGGFLLGLDFFVLNLLLYSAVFVPLERLFALRPDQPVFRRQWPVDLTYFFFNTLGIEILAILAIAPAAILFGWARMGDGDTGLGSLPLLVQVPALLLVADFTQYWVHRAFHALPFLWPFHAIHHSSEQLDWLAGSRLHLVDVILTRGLTYVPVFVLGFSERALVVYVFLVAAQATFIHANVRWELRPLRRLVATPAFHHWHHGAEREAVDTNFAVHTPIWDMLFGTYHLPERWPAKYGLAGPRRVPSNWATQLVYPFQSRSRRR